MIQPIIKFSAHFIMISCYLGRNTPQKCEFRLNSLNGNGLFHFTVKQVQQLKTKYDDVIFEGHIIKSVMLLGNILSYKDGISPTKKPIRTIKFKDSSGICTIQIFQGLFWEMIPTLIKKKDNYVNICVDLKSQGQFKYQVKLTLISLSVVKSGNEISLHMMNVIKDFLKMKS